MVRQGDAPATEQLPIDIDYAKFLPWLVDRRRVPRDWHTYLKSARSLLRHALSLTPPPALAALNLSPPDALSPPLPYFHALDVLAALTAHDAPAHWQAGPDKDILGRYRAPTSRAWAAAVAAFEKSHVYLADCAQVLVRNTDVEAHALKAAIAALQKDAIDLARRDAPAVRAAADAKERFYLACREFDLPKDDNVDFYAALREAVAHSVPVLLRHAVQCAKHPAFVHAIRYYADFVAYVRQARGDAPHVVCEAANCVVEGDVDSLIKPPVETGVTAADVTGVDWGIDVASDGLQADVGPTEIDWGIEIDTSGSIQATTLGNGDSSSAGVDVPAAAGDAIDWNESAEGDGQVGGHDDDDSDAHNANCFALTDPKSRELYLNDLIELDAFLAQRVAEFSRAGNTEIGLVMQQASETPDFVKAVDVEQLALFQQAVQDALRAINSAETRRMLALQSDDRRLERAARAILEKKHVAERVHAAINVLRKRRARTIDHLAAETPKLEELGRITRDIKKRTEKALSELYKGRVVHILGEINNVFPPGG